ncbi:hypothetical protein MtrunA17_Chr1g0169531 [Medicago truncatula]|uniref:ARO1-like protein n=2 Tax=Medicago truncatula TaxID=3880 RepID=A0A072VSW9_MEDTR|nr:ARO1-like protein [Medicago truncatula]RHN78767.1 hypothetical protein MtrunA17_Chr1g0169531 [Medicago truncatula]
MGKNNYSLKRMLANLVQLADKVAKAAEKAIPFKQECGDIRSKVEKLSDLLRQAAMITYELYEPPTRHIFWDTLNILNKALSLLLKKRIFIIIPVSAFSKTSTKLQNSIGNFSWLFRISSLHDDNQYIGLPPIAANTGMIYHIWEQMAILRTGSPKDRSDAAASLMSLADDINFYTCIIILEGGVVPILKLMKEGNTKEGKQTAARAIALFVSDIAADKQVVSFICEQISILHTDSLEDRSDAAASLVFLANESDRYGEMIIEEGGVGPLLKLMKEEGNYQGRENAAKAIRILKPINSAIILNTNATIGTQEDLSLCTNIRTPVHFIREKRINKHNVFGKLYESNQISEIV